MNKPRTSIPADQPLGRPFEISTEVYPLPWTVALEPVSRASREQMAHEWVDQWNHGRETDPVLATSVGEPPPFEEVVEEHTPAHVWVMRDATGLSVLSYESRTRFAADFFVGMISTPDQPYEGSIRQWLAARLCTVATGISLVGHGLPPAVWKDAFERFGPKMLEAIERYLASRSATS